MKIVEILVVHLATIIMYLNKHDMMYSIQDFDTIVSSEISLEMEALNVCKDSLISMEIDTFDR